jgi:hypothetical protein
MNSNGQPSTYTILIGVTSLCNADKIYQTSWRHIPENNIICGTSVKIYQALWRHIPENNILCGTPVKSTGLYVVKFLKIIFFVERR